MQTIVKLSLLNAVCTNPAFAALMSGETIRTPALEASAILVKHLSDDQRVAEIITAMLPVNYSSDTLNELPGLIQVARERELDRRKFKNTADGAMADKVLALFDKSGAKLFHCKNQQAYVGLPGKSGGFRNLPVQSEDLRSFLQKLYFNTYDGQAMRPADIKKVVLTLDARARFASPQCRVAMRVGGDLANVYIDLGDKEGRIVEISATGYRIVLDSPVKMVRRGSAQALPLPLPATVSGEESALNLFAKLLGQDFPVMQGLIGFLLSALHPHGSCFNLLVEGPKASDKGIICDFVKDLIDPFWPHRTSRLKIKNVSLIGVEMSDGYCQRSTGAGSRRKTSYKDEGIKFLDNKALLIINGIHGFVDGGDLLRRAITIRLKPTERSHARVTEHEVKERFAALRPALLHELFMAAAASIANLGDTPRSAEVSNVEAAQWVQAAETYLGWEQGSFVANLAAQQTTTEVETKDTSLVTTRMLEFLGGRTKEEPYEGLYSHFYKKLIANREGRSENFPGSASALSQWVTNNERTLKESGVYLNKRLTKRGSHVTAWLDPKFHGPTQ